MGGPSIVLQNLIDLKIQSFCRTLGRIGIPRTYSTSGNFYVGSLLECGELIETVLLWHILHIPSFSRIPLNGTDSPYVPSGSLASVKDICQ